MGKYENIIVGIDTSVEFYYILKNAMYIAKSENSQLSIVSAIPFIPDTDIINTTIELGVTQKIKTEKNYKLFIEEKRKMLKKYVLEAKKYGIKKINIIIEIDNPGDLILDIAKNSKKNLIVIGSSSKNLFKRFILGSTAQYLAINSICNILIVKTCI